MKKIFKKLAKIFTKKKFLEKETILAVRSRRFAVGDRLIAIQNVTLHAGVEYVTLGKLDKIIEEEKVIRLEFVMDKKKASEGGHFFELNDQSF